MSSGEKHPMALPNGFGFTNTTVKYRTDVHSRSGRTRKCEGTPKLKRSVTIEMGDCTLNTTKKSKDSVQNENGNDRSKSRARKPQSLVMSCRGENTLYVVETKDICEMDDLPSLSPESECDERTEIAQDEKERRLKNAEATDSENSKSASSCDWAKRASSIEMDALIASRVLEHSVTPNMKDIPQDYIDSKPSDQPSAPSGFIIKTNPKPVENNTILIPHKYQTDTPLGDYFGATLSTYERKPGGSYKYQHLLKDIKDGYPAKTMRIGKGDELVLVGEEFTPDLDHTEVLNIFHHDVKVDGKTRFCLVLRQENRGKKNPWYWYETSAILAPDPKEHLHDAAPIVKELHYGQVNDVIFKQKIRFSIYDRTVYMSIDKSGIHGVHVKNEDDSIYVNKIIKISLSKHDSAFPDSASTKAALCGKDGASYVRVENHSNICISDEPMCTWFECDMVGSDNKFHIDGYYLSFNKITENFVMTTQEGGNCVRIFKDVGRLPGMDSTDCACALRRTPEGIEMEVEITPSIPNTCESGYASAMGSQETPDDTIPQSPICLSADNLEIDSFMM